MNTRITTAIETSRKLINDFIFLCESRAKTTYFTRDRIATFKVLILFMLNFIRKSITLEIDNFFNELYGGDITIKKQSILEARTKILPKAFIMLNDAIIKNYYQSAKVKTYLNYRVSAIDGSVLEIPNTEEAKRDFGYVITHGSKVARAQVSTIYDVENDLILISEIVPYGTNERDIAETLIDKLEEQGYQNDLILFDRGYPSGKLLKYLASKPIKYVIRTSSATFKNVKDTTTPDEIVTIKTDGELIKVRVIKFMLPSGVEEILITNLFEEELTLQNFKEIYFKRWGIEEKYKTLKSRLQIENFTSTNKVLIEQDFYATVYLSNMVSLAKADADEVIAQKNKEQNLKYEYQANTNIAVGKLKDNLILILIDKNPITRIFKLNRLMKDIAKNAVPIRRGRSNYRDIGKSKNINQLNQKRSL